MNALTVVRIAIYAMLPVIFLVPSRFVVYVIVAQIGLVAASFYLRRRERRLA